MTELDAVHLFDDWGNKYRNLRYTPASSEPLRMQLRMQLTLLLDDLGSVLDKVAVELEKFGLSSEAVWEVRGNIAQLHKNEDEFVLKMDKVWSLVRQLESKKRAVGKFTERPQNRLTEIELRFYLDRFDRYKEQFVLIASMDDEEPAKALMKATKSDAGVKLAELFSRGVLTTGNKSNDEVFHQQIKEFFDASRTWDTREELSRMFFDNMLWVFSTSPNPLSFEIQKRFEGGSIGSSSKDWRVVATRCAGFCLDILQHLFDAAKAAYAEPAISKSKESLEVRPIQLDAKGGRPIIDDDADQDCVLAWNEYENQIPPGKKVFSADVARYIWEQHCEHGKFEAAFRFLWPNGCETDKFGRELEPTLDEFGLMGKQVNACRKRKKARLRAETEK